MPGFQPSKLTRLDGVAEEVGVGAVYLKDESNRLELSSFKILGASWGAHQAIVRKLGLPLDASIQAVKATASAKNIKLFAATDGNHGRALARMGTIFSVPVEIYAPASMHSTTAELIRAEGAKVVETSMSYDEAILEAQRATALHSGGLLIQDSAFEGYEDTPQWIVDGYSTMMVEIDKQLGEIHADLVVAPVGVGSFAQAAVTHFKRHDQSAAVLTVEPDTAACLWKSLRRGERVSEKTTSTIMAGLECGTVSAIAWPLLQAGVDASITVSDYESHLAVLELEATGVSAGPCGAAPLAALRRLSAEDRKAIGLSNESVVVLLCTEGVRDYDTPIDTSVNDATSLTQALVRINSANPQGVVPGPGETEIARFIRGWFEYRDIETHWIEPTAGRPSIVAVVRGSGGGQSIMLNGHIDTVAITGYNGDPLSGLIHGKKLMGRGSADMKGGVAASMMTLANVKDISLLGDVIFTGVADEEDQSIGTEQILEAGWRADGAIVSEPTSLQIIAKHKGFVWFEVDILGSAAHGSRPDLGVDAITKAGYLLVELDHYSQRLLDQHGTEGPSIHASLIKGGLEASSYPASCTVTIERRTVLGETPQFVQKELQLLLEKVAKQAPGFSFVLRATFNRPPFDISPEHPFAALVKDVVGQALETEPTFNSQPYWTDSALLAEAGIPSIVWGPSGGGFHETEEWVDVDSVEQVAAALTGIARRFCSKLLG